jgi:hypothetical protein
MDKKKKSLLKKEKQGYELSTKSQSLHKETNALMRRAQKIVQSNSLFKLPKDKAKILEAKLRTTISSDLEGKRNS